MFEISMGNFSLSGLPRVFLGSRVPGFVSAQDTVCLPLTLDGQITDTGVSPRDSKSLEGFLRERSHFFASSRPIPVLYPSQDAFKAVVQPPWLTTLSRKIDKTLKDYDGFFGSSTVLDEHLRRLFLDRWSQVQSLMSATLYVSPLDLNIRFTIPSAFMLFPQDLSLYALEPRLDEITSNDFVQFLGAYLHVNALMATGMTDRICVLQPAGAHQTEKPLYDASPEKSDLRPVLTLRSDPEGHINPLADMETNIHRAYDAFLNQVARENMIFLGFFLLALYRFDEDDLGSLMKLYPRERKNLEASLQAEIIRRGQPPMMKASPSPGQEAFLVSKALDAISRLVWA